MEMATTSDHDVVTSNLSTKTTLQLAPLRRTPPQPSPSPLTAPDVFPFPFTAYSVQQQFMHKLFSTIEAEGSSLGVFESPTGTGKSLSLLCGAFAWLRANAIRGDDTNTITNTNTNTNANTNTNTNTLPATFGSNRANGSTAKRGHARQTIEFEVDNKSIAHTKDDDDDEPSWVKDHTEKVALANRQRVLEKEADRQRRLQSIREGGQRRKVRHRQQNSRPSSEWLEAALNGDDDTKQDADDDDEGNDEDEFLVADYSSDIDVNNMSSDDDDDDFETHEEEEHVTKIFYCSRTHSQLSQVMQELKNTPYGEDARAVVLGSRQTLCVNDRVLKLKSQALINDRCKDLQDEKTKNKSNAASTKKGCMYNDHKRIAKFSERVQAQVQDIEELKGLGARTQSCPYYGTRQSIAGAEIVAMPYNLLLHKGTREAVGIKLEGNIVIIDEAHNLMPTIESIHSAVVTGTVLQRAYEQLSTYHVRYKTKLNVKNIVYINQILTVLKAFIGALNNNNNNNNSNNSSSNTRNATTTTAATSASNTSFKNNITSPKTAIAGVNDFLFETKIDNINLFRLGRYFEISQVSKKVGGYVKKQIATELNTTTTTTTTTVTATTKPATTTAAAAEGGKAYVPKHISALKMVESFFACLTNADKDGRVLTVFPSSSCESGELRFRLLNPAVYFDDIVAKSRAVILAGGTMSPMNSFAERLLTVDAKLKTNVALFSCGHIVPSRQLLAGVMKAGPSGKSLNFSFSNRRDVVVGARLIQDLGQLVLNICNVVPEGMVVFFPSYDYEQTVYVVMSAVADGVL